MPGERLERLAVIGRRSTCAQGAMAPRFRVALSSGTTRAASMQHLVPEAVAGRAGAERVVEREQPRLDLGDGEARDRAGELLREDDALAARRSPSVSSAHSTMAMPSARSSAVSRNSARRAPMSGADHDAVDHHVDVVLELLVERRRVVDLVELAVDLHALEALLLQARRSPCGTRPCGRARPAPAGRAASSRAAPSTPVDHLADTVWLSIGRPVAGE